MPLRTPALEIERPGGKASLSSETVGAGVPATVNENEYAVPRRVGVVGVPVIVGATGAGVTVSSVLPLTAPSVALITVVPGATPCARPAELIVAAAGVAEPQET